MKSYLLLPLLAAFTTSALAASSSAAPLKIGGLNPMAVGGIRTEIITTPPVIYQPMIELPTAAPDMGVIYLRGITSGRDAHDFMKEPKTAGLRKLTFTVYKKNSYTKIIYSDFWFSNHQYDRFGLDVKMNGLTQPGRTRYFQLTTHERYSSSNNIVYVPFTTEWVFFNLAPGTYTVELSHGDANNTNWGGSGSFGFGSPYEDWRLEAHEMSWPLPSRASER